MKPLSDYLKKFTGIVNNKQHAHKTVTAEIEKVLGIEIKKQAIEIKNGIIYLKESPIIKNTVFYSKSIILDRLQKAGLKVTDIK